jgi:hypothetical protein
MQVLLTAALVREDGMNADLGQRAGAHGTRAGGHLVDRYRRAVEPAVRGVAGVVLPVVFFAGGAAVGGRAGVAIASVWVAIAGLYCLANFWDCRETHCAVTGPGWTLAAVFGFAAALAPGTGLAWYRVTAAAVVFVVVLAAGFGLEWLVAARTGRRTLGRGRQPREPEGEHAEDR